MLFNTVPVTLFEVSWEVCNKVGGIYAVVSSKALQTKDNFGDRYFTLGPALQKNAGFEETDDAIWDKLRPALAAKELKCRLGRWNIPGRPRAILVDFAKRYDSTQLLHDFWQKFGVDSLSGGWDYIEPVMFSSACGEVIATIHETIVKPKEGRSVALFHEWMSGAGLLQVKKLAPAIGTVFTTHATMLGRSLAGSGVDIYSNLRNFNPASEAAAQNITAKWSMESTSAKEADAFTTVSGITGEEASIFLGRQPSVITTNGLDMRVIPDLSSQREEAEKNRNKILDMSKRFLRCDLPANTKIIAISGRYEFHNKGIDVFLEAMAQANKSLSGTDNTILALCLVMGGHTGVNEHAVSGNPYVSDNGQPFICTHHAWNAPQDQIINTCRRLGLNNAPGNQVKVIFNPAMLDGNDGFFNMTYDEIIAACDGGCFPSWYEPWGYTPQECAAWSVPTLTTDLSGFGMWARQYLKEETSHGVKVIARKGKNFEQTVEALHQTILDVVTSSPEKMQEMRKTARHMAEQTDWGHFFQNYIEAFNLALAKAEDRVSESRPLEKSTHIIAPSSSVTPLLRPMQAVAKIPSALLRLRDLSRNLWWCWSNKAKALFIDLNPAIWERSHNPIQVLEESDPERLDKMLHNKEYMERYEEVIAEFDNYMAEPLRTLSEHVTPRHPIAYFSTEYGLNESVPIYSGGLGVLSGDHLKSASDMAIPLIGIGLLYKNGYFKQVLDTNGRQTALYPTNNFAHLPIQLVKDENDEEIQIQLELPGRQLFARIWKMQVGRISLYLLDSDISRNTREDRRITDNLYVANRETRLLQEMLLGMGGVRLLRALGLEPHVFHMNEGHSAFMIIERLLENMHMGMNYQEARNRVRSNSLFTTHTPVAAGNESFTLELMQRYFGSIAGMLGLSWQQFVQLGQMEGSNPQNFEMTLLALRFSLWANGVSRLHGKVSRSMWNRLWKNLPLEETPITYVTNGVHVPSYVGMQMQDLLNQYLGPDWMEATPNSPIWDKVDDIPDDEYWAARMTQKEELLNYLRESIPDFVRKFNLGKNVQKTLGRLLLPHTLIIGFARRFAPYKRATLLFADPDRLAQIMNNPEQPVCFVFAGKAHPADEAGNDLIQKVLQMSQDPRFLGKIFFIEDYNMAVSRMLAQGCDVWLNTPRRPYEASGTSGMKLPVNGGVNFSISDGWWCEGYNRENGWTIGPVVNMELPTNDQNDYADAESLYHLLENEVIPLYHDLNENDLPTHWIALSKRSMKSLTAMYSSNRMLQDYVDQAYLPAAERRDRMADNNWALLRQMTAWEQNLPARFGTIKAENILLQGVDGNIMTCGQSVNILLKIHLGQMRRDEVVVQFVIGTVDDNGNFNNKPDVITLEGHPSDHGKSSDSMTYSGSYVPVVNGNYRYGIRIMPMHEGLSSLLDTNLTTWA